MSDLDLKKFEDESQEYNINFTDKNVLKVISWGLGSLFLNSDGTINNHINHSALAQEICSLNYVAIDRNKNRWDHIDDAFNMKGFLPLGDNIILENRQGDSSLGLRNNFPDECGNVDHSGHTFNLKQAPTYDIGNYRMASNYNHVLKVTSNHNYVFLKAIQQLEKINVLPDEKITSLKEILKTSNLNLIKNKSTFVLDWSKVTPFIKQLSQSGFSVSDLESIFIAFKLSNITFNGPINPVASFMQNDCGYQESECSDFTSYITNLEKAFKNSKISEFDNFDDDDLKSFIKQCSKMHFDLDKVYKVLPFFNINILSAVDVCGAFEGYNKLDVIKKTFELAKYHIDEKVFQKLSTDDLYMQDNKTIASALFEASNTGEINLSISDLVLLSTLICKDYTTAFFDVLDVIQFPNAELIKSTLQNANFANMEIEDFVNTLRQQLNLPDDEVAYLCWIYGYYITDDFSEEIQELGLETDPSVVSSFF
jgi:hypothetical protein